MGQGVQDGARQHPGAQQAERKPQRRACGQQEDALAGAAGRGFTVLGHPLLLKRGELVHRCCIGVRRWAQLAGDGLGGQGFARLAAFDKIIAHRSEGVACAVHGVKQGLGCGVVGQHVQALAHFGRAGRRGLAVSIDAGGVGGVVDLQQSLGAHRAEHHNGMQLTREHGAL